MKGRGVAFGLGSELFMEESADDAVLGLLRDLALPVALPSLARKLISWESFLGSKLPSDIRPADSLFMCSKSKDSESSKPEGWPEKRLLSDALADPNVLG